LEEWGNLLLHFKRGKMNFPKVTIGIVRSREDFFDTAFRSASSQLYTNKIKVIVIENRDRSKTIGKCFNEIVQKAKTDYVFFLGDDDRITPEYILSLMARLLELQETHKNMVGISSYCTLFKRDQDHLTKALTTYFDKIPTGMWLRSFLLENPFDELLSRFVDSDLFNRVNKMDDAQVGLVPWNFGYYYRQHGDNVSGDKFNKTKMIQVYGHKRSGNHYVCALIDKNITKEDNPVFLVGGHELLAIPEIQNKYIYIEREFETMAKSLFRYRHRQGLKVDDYDTFLNTKYSDMYDPDVECDVTYNMGTRDGNKSIELLNDDGTTTSKHFKGIHQTPHEYWDNHRKHWHKMADLYPDLILIVKYEDLLNDLQGTMLRISAHVGSDITQFEDIDTRVGWFPKNEEWSKDDKRQESSTVKQV
jgi:glycosyltransferase involved in cell wall biosynthesis